MSKHTPGPWVAIPTLSGAISINRTARVPIAQVGGAGWHLGQEMAEANARLIAAAPELLSALEEARLQIQYLHEKFSHTGSGNAVLSRIEAAIAKATGKETT
jgi:hypothetical protein